MKIEIVDGELRYKNDNNNWQVTLRSIDNLQEFEVFPIGTGSLICTSGVMLDNLAELITEAKADALSRGLNWTVTADE